MYASAKHHCCATYSYRENDLNENKREKKNINKVTGPYNIGYK